MLQFHEIKRIIGVRIVAIYVFGGSTSSSWEMNTMLGSLWKPAILSYWVKSEREIEGRFHGRPLHVHSRVEWSHSRVFCDLNTKLLQYFTSTQRMITKHSNIFIWTWFGSNLFKSDSFGVYLCHSHGIHSFSGLEWRKFGFSSRPSIDWAPKSNRRGGFLWSPSVRPFKCCMAHL